MCPIQKIFRQQEVDGLAAAKMLMKNVKNGLEFNCYHLRPLPFFPNFSNLPHKRTGTKY